MTNSEIKDLKELLDQAAAAQAAAAETDTAGKGDKSKPGPKTVAGKQRSSLNAMKHALTGQVVVLPEDDMAVYNAHLAKVEEETGAKEHLEKLLAKNIADCHWRIERIRRIENGTFAVGHMQTLKIDTGHARINDTICETQTFLAESKSLANLTLYEQRILRGRKQDEARLKELVEARKAREAKALEEAKLLAKLAYMKNRDYNPQTDGFVFSSKEIRAAVERDLRIFEAKHYEKHGFHPKNRPQMPRLAFLHAA
jgi:hypothetical protein